VTDGSLPDMQQAPQLDPV